MLTVLNQKPSCPLKGGLAFLLVKDGLMPFSNINNPIHPARRVEALAKAD